MKRFITHWMPVLIFSIILLFLSGRQNLKSPIEFDHIDLLAHAIFYAGFAFFLARAMGIGLRSRNFSRALIVICVVTVYGGLMEWYQFYIPTRHPSIADGIANGIGACMGVLVYILYRFYRRNRHRMIRVKS